MDNFLKPFLEKETGLSTWKTPISINETTDSNFVKYLQKIIFKQDVLVDFKEILNSTCSSEPFSVQNVTFKNIVKGLSKVLNSENDIRTKVDVFRYVFQSFVQSCKESESLYVMQFFIVLSHVLGISGDDCVINVESFNKSFKVLVSTPSLDSFLIFKELLLSLSKTSVNLNSDDVQSYYKWLQNVIKNIAKFRPFQNVFLEIFQIAAEVDLKLFETNFDDIFSSILSQGEFDNDFVKSYASFLESSFKICAQFQRTVKFISKFLSSIKVTPTTFTKTIVIPPNFIMEFSTVVSVASNQQSLSLMDVLLQNINECLLSQKESGQQSPLLIITAELSVNFFKNVKLFAPSIAMTTLQAFIVKLNTLKQSLQDFGGFLFTNKSFLRNNEEIVRIYLELCFYCGEIQMLIDCYKDSILNMSDVKEPEIDSDWQCCISVEQWKKLVSFVMKSKLESCDAECFQLAIQKLRSSQLKNKPLEEDSTLKLIIHQLTSALDKFNLFQQLPPEDLTILMNSLTEEQSVTVTEGIFKLLQKCDNKTEMATWMLNTAVQENEVFIVNLFSEILKRTGFYLQDLIKDKHSSKIAWFCDGCSVSGEIVEQLPDKVNGLIKSGKKLRKFITNTEFLIGVVEIFKFLPIFYMKEDFRKLGLGFVVGMSVLLADDENAVVAFESVYNYLFSNVDASTCFDVGLFIKFLIEVFYKNDKTECLKVRIIECLVKNSVNMKFGLNQLEEMIDSPDSFSLKNPMRMLKTQVLLYNELGKCWQRSKKRKSDNDLIGSCRTKLAKIISEESKQLPEAETSDENIEIFFRIFSIEIHKYIKLKDEKQLEKLILEKFPLHFEFAVKKLKKGHDEPSIMFLTTVLQFMPEVRKFLPENSVLSIWRTLKCVEKVNWRLFCVNTTEEEFKKILEDLLNISQKFLHSNTDKHSSNCFEIWISFFEFTSGPKKHSCQLQLLEFFNYIHDCHLLLRDLPISKKIHLMKFFSFCVTNKEVVVTSHVIDTVISVVLECDDVCESVDDFQNLFNVEVDVSSAVLTKQFVWSKSKVHLIFMLFKHLLKLLMKRCDGVVEDEKGDVFKLATCAFSLEKWVSLMLKKEKDFARISAYFITALISSIASVTVLPAIKIHLTNCINHFLTMSDSHTTSYLMRILKPGYQQVFNSLFVQFKKYHKYSGKI